MAHESTMKIGAMFIIGILIILSTIFLINTNQSIISSDNSLNYFSSGQELADFLKSHRMTAYGLFAESVTTAKMGVAADNSGGTSDFSTTNIQVGGVDEPDIVKNDGKYIYTLTGSKVVIVKAYPAKSMELLSEINLSGLNPRQIFINGDKLVVFGQEYKSYPMPLAEVSCLSLDEKTSCPEPYSESRSLIMVYDISDRKNPELESNISIDGDYLDARMIGDYVYTISNKYLAYDYLVMPTIIVNGEIREISATDIYYPELNESSYQFTIVTSLNLNNREISEKVLLMGNSQSIYASENNIYATYTRYSYSRSGSQEITNIHKISIDDGRINFVASGSVPGHILNQFSMDEYDNHFRIATTISGYVDNRDTSTSNIYVLDENLNLTGSVNEIAPGESIYSVRFMGKRAYLVTFRHVDPLFVIDLSDVENPRILGQLKIPGYSDYLHPYDETHIIGIGKDVDASIDADKVHTEGAVYYTAIQGVKISLFDVSDVENPIEMDKVIIGNRGTESLATSDHKAFLFDKAKNLLVVPMIVAELSPGQSKSEQGSFTFSGAYVYKLTLEDGLEFKGRITHQEDNDSLLKAGYYYSIGARDILRSLYINDVLYTISNRMIKTNDISSLDEIDNIELPYEEYYYGYYGYDQGILF